MPSKVRVFEREKHLTRDSNANNDELKQSCGFMVLNSIVVNVVVDDIMADINLLLRYYGIIERNKQIVVNYGTIKE